MGAFTSRQHAGVEEVDIVSNHAYKYPPRSGNYFGSHFIMGGERFDTPQPEAYLFGENADLNFLGSKPTPFPYPPPQANEPTKTLKCLVNIRKESLRFVRSPESIGKCGDVDIEAAKSSLFNIEFTFDCDTRCAITIYYFCTEEVTPNGIVFHPRNPGMNSETFHYKRGSNQLFSQATHVFDPSCYSDEELTYNTDKEIIPIAIHCVAEDGSDEPHQSHTTIAVVDHHSDGTYVLKALKQKLYVDGLCYLLQEIYGIENKNNDTAKAAGDEDTEDNGSECVICMCDVRDTLILPCRHLCLCNSCADSLRYQANNCPICRAPFRALLQIRALQKSCTVPQPAAILPPEGSCENIPAGYEAVSLIEALNGPPILRALPIAPVMDLAETPDQEVAVQAAEVLNRSSQEQIQCTKQILEHEEKSPRDRTSREGSLSCTTPEFRMSVLLAREDENHKEQSKSPLLVRHSVRPHSREKNSTRPRDTVRLVNEKTVDQTEENIDDDSEAEKLSPLLEVAGVVSPPATVSIIGNNLDDEDEEEEDEEEEEEVIHVDSLRTKDDLATTNDMPTSFVSDAALPTDMDGCVVAGSGGGGGEDSDYYTPEDPATTILSPLHSEKERPLTNSDVISSVESTPGRWTGIGISLPGTPISHLSHRSSGDSYSSSSSTRQLLNGGNHCSREKQDS
ncbi:probable E3 ubiquitin-protein ligase MGRN1 isoform X1 [Schistocerca gregaria]|uniref:probable E3 ubiquitin-protein ligase MGRN1 isoform X1 n=2 Tax=Schistocerca gregaria TaxID=7010 RepID=UPI00211EAEC8|nr:probable E3 ubiquitin-protein ligase MGRN1 isoform X1 [Schistocerca gregaria]